jgi:hypothetical protein
MADCPVGAVVAGRGDPPALSSGCRARLLVLPTEFISADAGGVQVAAHKIRDILVRPPSTGITVGCIEEELDASILGARCERL